MPGSTQTSLQNRHLPCVGKSTGVRFFRYHLQAAVLRQIMPSLHRKEVRECATIAVTPTPGLLKCTWVVHLYPLEMPSVEYLVHLRLLPVLREIGVNSLQRLDHHPTLRVDGTLVVPVAAELE